MQIKRIILASTPATLTGILCLAGWPGLSYSAPDGFGLCDGQTGVALGLCQGGVAAGCAGATASVMACSKIEDKYFSATGGYDAPWIYLHYPVQTLSGSVPNQIDLETGQIAGQDGIYPPMFHLIQDLDVYFWDQDDSHPNDIPWTLRTFGCFDSNDPRQTARYAVLPGIAFASVTTASIGSATFVEATAPNILLPTLEAGDTVIWNTCRDNYFKIGNMSCFEYEAERVHLPCNDETLPDFSWKVEYQLLSPAR